MLEFNEISVGVSTFNGEKTLRADIKQFRKSNI